MPEQSPDNDEQIGNPDSLDALRYALSSDGSQSIYPPGWHPTWQGGMLEDGRLTPPLGWSTIPEPSRVTATILEVRDPDAAHRAFLERVNSGEATPEEIYDEAERLTQNGNYQRVPSVGGANADLIIIDEFDSNAPGSVLYREPEQATFDEIRRRIEDFRTECMIEMGMAEEEWTDPPPTIRLADLLPHSSAIMPPSTPPPTRPPQHEFDPDTRSELVIKSERIGSSVLGNDYVLLQLPVIQLRSYREIKMKGRAHKLAAAHRLILEQKKNGQKISRRRLDPEELQGLGLIYYRPAEDTHE